MISKLEKMLVMMLVLGVSLGVAVKSVFANGQVKDRTPPSHGDKSAEKSLSKDASKDRGGNHTNEKFQDRALSKPVCG